MTASNPALHLDGFVVGRDADHAVLNEAETDFVALDVPNAVALYPTSERAIEAAMRYLRRAGNTFAELGLCVKAVRLDPGGCVIGGAPHSHSVANETRGRSIRMTAGKHRTQEIHITARPTGEISEPEDNDVPGRYVVLVPAELPASKAASVALDVFHSNVPVGVLDEFSFIVSKATGEELEQDPQHEDYSGSDLGEVVSHTPL